VLLVLSKDNKKCASHSLSYNGKDISVLTFNSSLPVGGAAWDLNAPWPPTTVLANSAHMCHTFQ